MGGYLGTSIVYGTARILIDATTPLSEIAYANRKAVEKALEPEEIHMQFAIHREMVRLGQPIHACEPWEYSYSVTSWAGAWNGIDFSSVGSQKGAAPEFHVLGASGEKGAPRRCELLPCRSIHYILFDLWLTSCEQSTRASCPRRKEDTGSTFTPKLGITKPSRLIWLVTRNWRICRLFPPLTMILFPCFHHG